MIHIQIIIKLVSRPGPIISHQLYKPSKILKIVSLIELIIGATNWNNTRMKSKMAINPNCSIDCIIRCKGSGANAYSKREPSRGGKGIILKTNSATLTNVNTAMPSDKALLEIGNNWNISPLTQANARFDKGPAIPINATPNSSCLTREGLNGTGLAANIGGRPSRISTIGSKTVVYMSMCFKGLRVSRPSS
jgi:hypothetical protein